ncbi:PAC2 family protein [Kribbella sp. NBC_01245]|uniref:proteasome assembly chaperone family protein n=1 Tax=Kribbella sp. NBC_01245 TaxID=2903578 RepID=UPI002E29806C|nr:PAC2 family protein [Kribbella sp. NBC_01245]
MLRPDDLYEIVDESVATGPAAPPRVLVHALDGFMDAGQAGRVTADHLLDVLESRVVARFDVDLMHDYRARRPEVTFAEDRFIDYDPPELLLHLLVDDAGVEFLLLEGAEPDMHWERFAAAVRNLIERFNVTLTIGVHGIPMGVPHTRPLGLTAHATRPELVTRSNIWDGEMRLPASVASMLQVRLGEAGRDAMGFAVHVPHYLAENRFPGAALALVHAVSAATGLLLPSKALLDEAAVTGRMVDEQVQASEDATAVVSALETQYDAAAGSISRGSLLAAESIPSGDELGAELEQFLADLNRDDEV